MQNGKLFIREQVFGGKQLTLEIQSRYMLSLEETPSEKIALYQMIMKLKC